MSKLLQYLGLVAAAGLLTASSAAAVEGGEAGSLAQCIESGQCPPPSADVERPDPCTQGGCGIDGKKRRGGRGSSFAGRGKNSWSGSRSQSRSVFKAGSKGKGKRWRRGKTFRRR